MKELHFISAQPNDLYFCWQLRVQLHNFRKHGYSSKYTPLILYSKERENQEDFQEHWDLLVKDFPETQFFFYEDKTKNIFKAIRSFGYIPLLRPWLLKEHWTRFPELKDKAIFYTDSDVVFTKPLDFSKFLDDDINYLSDTISYIGAQYWDSKKEGKIKPSLKKQFDQIDVLDQTMRIIGMDRKIADENQESSGGAQYLLKNIDAKFWEKVLDTCMVVKMHLHAVNQRYFQGASEEEEKEIPNQTEVFWQERHGYQAWCADMWAVLWNLWKRGGKTNVPKEFDFAHATDSFERLKEVYLYHDAGVHPSIFNKRKKEYVDNILTPYEDEIASVPPELASYFYVTQIMDSKESFHNQN